MVTNWLYIVYESFNDFSLFSLAVSLDEDFSSQRYLKAPSSSWIVLYILATSVWISIRWPLYRTKISTNLFILLRSLAVIVEGESTLGLHRSTKYYPAWCGYRVFFPNCKPWNEICDGVVLKIFLGIRWKIFNIINISRACSFCLSFLYFGYFDKCFNSWCGILGMRYFCLVIGTWMDHSREVDVLLIFVTDI